MRVQAKRNSRLDAWHWTSAIVPVMFVGEPDVQIGMDEICASIAGMGDHTQREALTILICCELFIVIFSRAGVYGVQCDLRERLTSFTNGLCFFWEGVLGAVAWFTDACILRLSAHPHTSSSSAALVNGGNLEAFPFRFFLVIGSCPGDVIFSGVHVPRAHFSRS